MQRLHRPPVKLPTLTVGAGAKKALKHLEDRTDDPTAELDFPAHWNEPDVRGALYAMHGRICAFCLSELPRGDRGDVEHFRPKSLYFWLAYAFENYLLSCSECNRRFKRDHFPLAGGARRIAYQDRGDLEREERLFLDPVEDRVEEWLIVDTGGEFFFWNAAPSLPEGSLERARVIETRCRFHWNDDAALVKARTDAIDEALFEIERGNREEARRRASRFRPHGGAVRSLLASLGAVPLPTIAEETDWLLEELWQEWEGAKKIGGELCEKKLEELAWAFAVLWKAPAAGDPAAMEGWVIRAGVKAEVEPKYRML